MLTPTTVVSLLFLLIIVVIAVFIIDHTLPGDVNLVAKMVVGVVALIVLLSKLGIM